MAAERIIGVDFGTSTSVIRVKRYDEQGNPLGERLGTMDVVFNMVQITVPTLVRQAKDVLYYGYEAQPGKKGSTLYQGFKVQLESDDADEKKRARELTEKFFGYMADAYRTQSDGGHLGETGDRQRTIVSYPVKWSDETKKFMLQAARKAGFPNVEGMDEAQAAIQAVIVQNGDHLQQQGILKAGIPANILLIDMGAGTTDMVLCRYTPGEHPKNEILCTRPKKGDILFGGQEVERILRDNIRSRIPEDVADQAMKNVTAEKFKTWKDSVISPALARRETVREFSELDFILEALDTEMDEYGLNQELFEDWAGEYLRCFPRLVNECVQESGLSADKIDLVILTGGHSQWYFVQEMLSGKKKNLGEIRLPKIQSGADAQERILAIWRPQETVALGMAYSPLIGDFQSESVESAEKEEKNQSLQSRGIGIDLGKKCTRMAVLRSGRLRLLGEHGIPSYIICTDQEEWLCGKEALTYAGKSGRTAIPVRECLENWNCQGYNPWVLLKEFLRKLKQDAESYLGEALEFAVIATSEELNAFSSYLLQTAAVEAGWKRVHLRKALGLAAVYYTFSLKPRDENILICGLEKDYMEAALVDVGEGVAEIMGSAAQHCGKEESGECRQGKQDWKDMLDILSHRAYGQAFQEIGKGVNRKVILIGSAAENSSAAESLKELLTEMNMKPVLHHLYSVAEGAAVYAEKLGTGLNILLLENISGRYVLELPDDEKILLIENGMGPIPKRVIRCVPDPAKLKEGFQIVQEYRPGEGKKAVLGKYRIEETGMGQVEIDFEIEKYTDKSIHLSVYGYFEFSGGEWKNRRKLKVKVDYENVPLISREDKLNL